MTEATHQALTTYAALALHDDGADITAAAITKMIEAAGATVPAYFPMLFARMLSAQGCSALLMSGGGGGGGGGGAAAGGAAAGGGGGAAAEEKKEEVKEEEEEEDMDFDLFG